MEKLKKIIKMNWIALWLILAAVLFTSISAFAIYTRITIAKRVVSTQAGVSGLFSSDYMSARGIKTTESSSDTTQNYSVDVHIYNYVYPKEAVYRSDSTQYDITAKIGTLNDSDVFYELGDSAQLNGLTYSVTYNTDPADTFIFNATNGTTHTFTACEIAGGGPHLDSFTLVFDKSELGENPKGFCIQLTATPYDNDLPVITGLVNVKYAKQASTGWKGEVQDLDTNDMDKYDGFNYYLDGNGKGKITFRWKKDFVTINKSFLTNIDNVFYYKSGDNYVRYTSLSDETNIKNLYNGYYSLTMDVNSVVQNRYEIQFYKVDPSQSYTKPDVISYLPSTIPSDWEPETD